MTTSGSLSLSYDLRGNTASDGVNGYTYDAENRLTGISGGAGLSYDAQGRLYQIGTATRMLYDGVNLIGEYDAANAVLRRYVHGLGTDEPLVWYEGSGTSDARWLVANQQGSIIAVTSASGAALAVNTYDEYGVPGGGNLGRFQYTGQQWIAEVGLYHYKARAYSPRIGRFMQTDPIGYADGMNWYAYVDDDPMNRTDPTGLASWLVSYSVVPGLNHMFVAGGVELGVGKMTHQYSYGPHNGTVGALLPVVTDSRLTEQRGSNSLVDRTDRAAWATLGDPKAAAKAGITAVRIPASDENVVAAGNAMDRRLGTNDKPGDTRYAPLVNPLSDKNTANSNSAAAGIAEGAVNADRKPGEPREKPPLPSRGFPVGYGQHDKIR